MSLDELTAHPSDSSIVPHHRSWTWLLPVGLIVGFLLVMTLLFGARLLPAIDVQTASVVTLRLSWDESNRPSFSQPQITDSAPESDSSSQTKSQGRELVLSRARARSMIFQASGWVEPDPYLTYVPALINGVVDEVHVLEGQTVKKGDLLATLIDDDAKLELKNAELKINSQMAKITAHCVGSEIARSQIHAAEQKIDAIKAQQSDAIDNLKRLEKLPLEAIPEQQVVQARLDTIRYKALVAEAEAAVPQLMSRIKQIELERESMLAALKELENDKAKAQLAMHRTRISSPMNGVVMKLFVAPGQKRMLNMDDSESAVIVTLYNPEQLQARIDVPLSEAAQLQAGQVVELSSDILPDTVFQGRVTRISGEADIQRNTLQAKVEILNPDIRLRPDMLVRAKFFSVMPKFDSSTSNSPAQGNQRLALFVPERSLVNESSIWVATEQNTAELRPIQLGDETRDGHRRVLDGLRSGEQVILPPHNDLTEGARVNISPDLDSK